MEPINFNPEETIVGLSLTPMQSSNHMLEKVGILF